MSAQIATTHRRRDPVGAALIAAELIGVLLLFAPIPFAWMWIGSFTYSATESLTADLATAFLGFTATTVGVMWLLNSIDQHWIQRRRRAGHDQRDGALNRVVIACFAIGLVCFWLWFNISGAVVIPFMPRY